MPAGGHHTHVQKTRRALELTDPIARGVLVTRDLGGGYSQTQAGPNAVALEGEELERELALDEDRPPADRIHRVELTPEELEELAHPDPELES